jgi:transcriptional regulator with XRE-family HTH domain
VSSFKPSYTAAVEKEAAKILGQRLKALRERQEPKMSQEKLAQRCGMSRNYVYWVEKGSVSSSLLAICKLAWALGCEPAELVADIGQD